MISGSRICSKTAQLMPVPLWLLLCLSLPVSQAASWAATINGRVELVLSHDPNVRKHRDYSGVVVWLDPLTGPPVISAKLSHAQMIQRNKTFAPHVLPILVGTVVNFPNYDPIFHNAFSNYDGQIFDIGLYAPGTTRAIAFRRDGVVRVFCNIHPTMSAVIVVLKSPYFAASDQNGTVEIEGVPQGSYRMHVFHERATEQTLDTLTRTIEISGDKVQLAPISVSESGYLQVPHKNKYGRDYQLDSDSGAYIGTKP